VVGVVVACTRYRASVLVRTRTRVARLETRVDALPRGGHTAGESVSTNRSKHPNTKTWHGFAKRAMVARM